MSTTDETATDVRCPACESADLTADYLCPVVVTIRDGEVWSVRVMDEAPRLTGVTCDQCGITLGRIPPAPVRRVLDDSEWPAWEFG
jgi:hypothetical protein